MEKIPHIQEVSPPFCGDGKFHVRLTKGRFQNLRRLTSGPLLALFFGLVWLEWQGQPLMLFSFAEHKLIVFGQVLGWHTLPLLAGLMIAGTVLLFFLAVGWGRVWCGFACPQSIWTWLFIRIEDFTEGPARQRAKAEPLRGMRLVRRISKHLLWVLLASATAITFTGYFVPVREILTELASLSAPPLLWGWIVIMAALTYLNGGLVREKICLHACPYSRFQTVMFDRHTRTVSYDAARGEPRAHKRSAADNSGDCVDCGLCVQVCPTGIDIRNGLQAACIDCAACIDACDGVMDSLKRPRGLIRFASDAQLKHQASPLWRPKLLSYAGLLLIAAAGVAYGFWQNDPVVLEVARGRGELFTVQGEKVCNPYRLKAESFARENTKLRVNVGAPVPVELRGERQLNLDEPLSNGQWRSYQVCVAADQAARMPLNFSLSGPGVQVERASTFIAP